MSEAERKIEELEAQIPALSGAAVKKAYERTLASGQSVLEAADGAIYEVFPDGSRKFIKRIEPSFPVDRGRIINIQ